MMFFFWRPYLQELVPPPDDRIHDYRICFMRPRELAQAKSRVQGRFYFGIILTVVIASGIILVYSSNIHRDEGGTIVEYLIMSFTGLIGALRIIYEFWIKSTRYKLIDRELERRRSDIAGKDS